MRERNKDMDFECELLEDTKAFLDDLYDHQIINISKGYIQPHPIGRILTNRHGKHLIFTTSAMHEAKRYCAWLIEIGAVKYEASEQSSVYTGGNVAS